MAITILLCERYPVALEFRQSSHSFSLTDVPLTLALVFASGTHAVARAVPAARSARCSCAGCRA